MNTDDKGKTIDSHRDLIVWQKSIQLVTEIYIVTRKFPKEEMYNLTNQMRRAAISIPSNIAEGYRRKSLGEYVQFLGIAAGSAAELETQVVITKNIYPKINVAQIESMLAEVEKMLMSLRRKLHPTA